MSLKSEAAKLYLSYLWWIIEPVLYVLTFYFVFEVLLQFNRGENFIFFLMCGKVPFLWFSKSVTGGSGSIVSGKGLINQRDVPKALFPYVTVQEVLYRQWVVFLVLFGIAFYFGAFPTWNWLYLVPLMLVQYVLILVCTMVAAYLVSFVRDVRVLVGLGMMCLMFTSGIFWDVSRIQDPHMQSMLLTWNPLAFLIDGYRGIIMRNEVYDVVHLAALGGVVAILLALVHGLYIAHSRLLATKVLSS
ncbi:ABC transporter permease [Marinimicrobium sp. ARAG 43.8]|uniref:ABC transporter permease n=1 Tax=Marinimicrobium sp. ARAG 43.8 TaxID=3418719 RepID=UPI003CF8B7B4